MIRSKSQTLITGCYRSGTEYITQLLGNQPRLASTMYLTNFMRYYWGQYDPISESQNYYRLVFDAARRTHRRWNREIDAYSVVGTCHEESDVDYALIYDLIMSDLLLGTDIRHWAEKTQLVWTKIPYFIDSFDEGRAIMIVRDPRSVLASFKEYTYEPAPAYLGAIFNMLDVFNKAAEYRESISESQFHVIRYEDIVLEPYNTLEKAFQFLNLSTDHDLLSEKGWKTTSGEAWEANSAYDDSDDFDAIAAINRWKDHLERWEVSLCEWIIGESMAEFNYKQQEVSEPEKSHVDVLRDDPQLSTFLTHWQETGEGVEAFPSDPNDPANWEENAKTS